MSDETSQPEAPARGALVFLCAGNAARSQMAEGFARFLGPAGFEVYSAGDSPGAVDPNAIRAMKEVGIDISGYRTKGLDSIPTDRVLTIINLGYEDERPELPGRFHHLHWPLPDPAAVVGNGDVIIAEFRRVRDQIRELVSRLF